MLSTLKSLPAVTGFQNSAFLAWTLSTAFVKKTNFLAALFAYFRLEISVSYCEAAVVFLLACVKVQVIQSSLLPNPIQSVFTFQLKTILIIFKVVSRVEIPWSAAAQATPINNVIRSCYIT
jgi:hypothetical protein